MRAGIRDGFALALIAEVVKDLQSEKDAIHAGNARKNGP
jgi:hypothetical protein